MNSHVQLDGLLGFILPRSSKVKKEIIYPTAFYHSSNDGKNQFFLRSYQCVEKKNKIKTNNNMCRDCKTFWRSYRNYTSIQHIKIRDHKRILKTIEKKFLFVDTELKSHKNVADEKIIHLNKEKNKLYKKASYWRTKCKSLEEAVQHWLKVELVRESMISIDDDEATKWANFYAFIDDLIDKEHFDSPEKRDLHKELIRSETCTLGKFNKRQDKRGIRTTKISSRVLNYSLTLANNLGKVNYEVEASLRSLPSWSSLTR